MARHFLIVFDGTTGRMREPVREFARPAPAVRAYADAERRFEREQEVQVVLIASDSLATVKKTHPNFWNSKDFETLARRALRPATG